MQGRQNAAMGTKPQNPRTVLAQNLKALMAHGDVNQSQLGRKADIAPTTVGRILKEKHAPDVDTLGALAGALGITVWQMMVPKLDPASLPALQNVTPEEQELYARLRAAAEMLTPRKHQ